MSSSPPSSTPPPRPSSSSAEPPPPTTPSTSKRRSARVQKRDPIVAPGFGTHKDLRTLSESLGLPVPAIQAIMESRGRGIRRAAEEKQEEAPISHAWADFMMEEGMTTEEQPSQVTTTATATTSTNKDSPREYKLPLKPDEPSKKKSKTTKHTAGSVLVQTGTLDSSMIGRTKRALDRPYDLVVPTVLFPSLKVTKVIASCSAAHAICIDSSGTAHGWGRNEAHQLTQHLPQVVPLPTVLEGITGTIVDGAVGKSHSVLLDSSHKLVAVGSNKVGQCGIRSSVDSVPNFRKCVLDVDIVQVSCGEQFTVALSNEGRIYTTGSSEFGQLGNGETGEYFIAANKIAFANCNEFTLRNVFCHAAAPGESASDIKVVPMDQQDDDVRIGAIACGKHHTIAIEAPSNLTPRVFTWGCGNYGCLGHGRQADEYYPRLVATFSAGPIWETNPPVTPAAGASCSMVLTKQGHVYYCGRHRSVGEAVMRPALLEALANNGHVVTHAAAGSQTVVCSTANAVTVSWGQGAHGELGYGEKKSSAKPQFVSDLDKCRIRDLACGQGITLFLVAEEDADDKAAIKQLKVFDPKDAAELEK